MRWPALLLILLGLGRLNPRVAASECQLRSISPEIPVSKPAYGAAFGVQEHPQVASDGEDFLAVWRDAKWFSRVFAARVSRSGEVLDIPSLDLGPIEDLFPAVAWGGNSYLVTWAAPDHSIRARRVSPAGEVSEETILERNIPRAALAVAAFDSGFLVVWSVAGRLGEIQGVILNFDGAKTARIQIPLSTPIWGFGNMALSTDGRDFILAYRAFIECTPSRCDSEFRAMRFTAAGMRFYDVRIGNSSAPPDFTAALVFDGHDYVIGWTDQAAIHIAKLSPDGIVGTEKIIFESGANFFRAGPVFAADRQGAIAVWIAPPSQELGGWPRLFIHWLSSDVTVTSQVNPSVDGAAPAVASNGQQALIVWSGEYFLRDVEGVVAQESGSVADTFVISTSAAEQSHTVVSSSGRPHLVAWVSGDDIFAVTLPTAGQPPADDGARLNSESVNPIITPAVATDGQEYLVIWGGHRHLFVRRISAEGKPMDPQPQILRENALCGTFLQGEESIAAAFDGANFLVVWSDCRTASRSLLGMRVSRAGVPLDPVPFVITAAFARNPRLVWTGDHYLAVWTREFYSSCFRTCTLADSDIEAARITSSALVLDPQPIKVASTPSLEFEPVIATRGIDSLIVWSTAGIALPENSDIRGAVVDRLGTIVRGTDGGVSIAVGPEFQAQPSVEWRGGRYSAVWMERTSPSLLQPTNLIYAEVTEDAELRCASDVLRSVSGMFSPLIAARDHALALLYSRIATEHLYGGVARTFVLELEHVGERRRSVRR